jgi:hypothetical protein
MARMWKIKEESFGTKNLLKSEYIVVEVASFRFGFRNTKTLKEYIAYFEKKTHPSGRISAKVLARDLGEDWRELRGWEVERWFERLPMFLFEEPKRQKVLKALRKTLELAESGKLKYR